MNGREPLSEGAANYTRAPADLVGLESRYGDLSTELLVSRTRRLRILIDHCEDEKALEGALDKEALGIIRQSIRERALGGDEYCWEINRRLLALEAEIENLQQEIFEVQSSQSERIKKATEDTDFS